MVAVAVDTGRGKDRGQSIEELQGRKTQGGAAGGVGPWEGGEDLIVTLPTRWSWSRAKDGLAQYRINCSRPAGSVASMRTLPSRLKPPP